MYHGPSGYRPLLHEGVIELLPTLRVLVGADDVGAQDPGWRVHFLADEHQRRLRWK